MPTPMRPLRIVPPDEKPAVPAVPASSCATCSALRIELGNLAAILMTVEDERDRAMSALRRESHTIDQRAPNTDRPTRERLANGASMHRASTASKR